MMGCQVFNRRPMLGLDGKYPSASLPDIGIVSLSNRFKSALRERVWLLRHCDDRYSLALLARQSVKHLEKEIAYFLTSWLLEAASFYRFVKSRPLE